MVLPDVLYSEGNTIMKSGLIIKKSPETLRIIKKYIKNEVVVRDTGGRYQMLCLKWIAVWELY